MNTNSFESAFTVATAELSEVSKQFEDLRVKKTQIETLLESLRPFLLSRDSSFNGSAAEGSSAQDAHQTTQPIKSAARMSPSGTKEMVIAVLKVAGKPMSVPDIYRALEENHPLHLPNKDAIRILMIRRGDIFTRLGGGLYGLVEEPYVLRR